MDGEAVVLTPDAWEDIWTHATIGAPYEVVGALLGRLGHVEQTWWLNNVSNEPLHHYRTDRADLMELYGEMDKRTDGLDVVGFYHSHPRTSAAPSEGDLDLSMPGLVYIICSLATREMQGFRCGGDSVEVRRG